MPAGAVNRALFYVGFLLLVCVASTFPWWLAANAMKAEYRRLMSALACAMRVFFYSICLLSILVAAKSLDLAPADPRDTLFGWIHIGGTLWVTFPSAWRAFRIKGPRLAGLVLIAWAGCAAMGAVTWLASPGFRFIVANLPRYLTSA